jgi:hypothetical protein
MKIGLTETPKQLPLKKAKNIPINKINKNNGNPQ